MQPESRKRHQVASGNRFAVAHLRFRAYTRREQIVAQTIEFHQYRRLLLKSRLRHFKLRLPQLQRLFERESKAAHRLAGTSGPVSNFLASVSILASVSAIGALNMWSCRRNSSNSGRI